MKKREAIEQAWRELGFTEEEILAAMKFMDRESPNHVPESNEEIVLGKERETIESLKSILGPNRVNELNVLLAAEYGRMAQRIKNQ